MQLVQLQSIVVEYFQNKIRYMIFGFRKIEVDEILIANDEVECV